MKNHSKCEAGRGGLSVIINPDKFEKSLRAFKKMVMTDGLLKEVRARGEFLKPSVKRRLARKEAVRRLRKAESFALKLDQQ